MESNRTTGNQEKPGLKTILAVELFAKLPEDEQDRIIVQLKALLSRG